MKEGWTYKKLGEVATFARGLTYSKNDEAESSNIVVLRSNNIDLISGKLDFSELKYLKETYEIPSDKRIKRGSLFICMSNGSKAHLGKVAYIDKDYNYAFGGFMGQITPTEEVDGLFLHYALCSPNYKAYIKSLSEGANINNLKFKDLSEFPLCYPPLSEQRVIVARLDSAFAQIDALKANAEKQLSEARKLFQKALEEVMTPKEGWEEKTLKEICSIITDGTHHSPINTSTGKYKYITAKNIRTWGLDLSNITYVSEEVHNEIISRCKPKKGDVLYIKDGATTGIAIVNPLEEEFSMLSSVALIRPKDQILSSEYLCYALNSPSIYKQTRSQMDGAAITRVTLVKIKSFIIPLPPLTTQHTIVAHLDDLSSHVRALEEKLKKMKDECDALKQAMLREVFE